MNSLRTEVIKYAKKLNSSNLSPFRSGNISIRAEQNGKEGFLITPSGIKYDQLKEENIVFLELDESLNNDKISKNDLNPSSEWRFHQDIYIKKKGCICNCAFTFPTCHSCFCPWKKYTSLSLHDSVSRR